MSSTLYYPYSATQNLILQVEGQPSDNLQVTILKVFEPFTLSCALLVQLDWPSLQLKGDYVLKLFDRRYATQLRRDHHASAWTPEIEIEYRAFVASGVAPTFFALCALKDSDYSWSSRSETSWGTANLEAYLQFCCQKQYTAERAVYEKLHDLQGKSVPRLAACVLSCDPSRPSLANEYLDCPGILMEYIQGFPLTDLDELAPQATWQQICDQAIQIVNWVSDRDIRNEDVKTRSFIVRQHLQSTPEVVMMDFGSCVLRQPDQDDDDWEEWKAMQDEEGAVGLVMQSKLKGGFVYVRSARSTRWQDKYRRE